jgi:hypothetical protein
MRCFRLHLRRGDACSWVRKVRNNDNVRAQCPRAWPPSPPFRGSKGELEHAHSLDNHYWLCRGRRCQARHAGDREPKGFILTTILGIVGAFVATYLGQAIGWYGPDQTRGLLELSWVRYSYC